MALTDLLKSFTRASAFGVALYACGGDGSERMGCRDDNDCTKGRICEYDQESEERYCVGGNEDNNLYSAICKDICATDGGRCAADFDLPCESERLCGSSCINGCTELFEGCSQYFMEEVNYCFRNYNCNDPNSWVPCLEVIETESSCNPW